jgi:hypothetical protein
MKMYVFYPHRLQKLHTDACTARLHLHYLASPLKKIGPFHRVTQKLKQTKFHADLGWDKYAHDFLEAVMMVMVMMMMMITRLSFSYFLRIHTHIPCNPLMSHKNSRMWNKS